MRIAERLVGRVESRSLRERSERRCERARARECTAPPAAHERQHRAVGADVDAARFAPRPAQLDARDDELRTVDRPRESTDEQRRAG
jgi:hypothetical protein